MKNYFVQQIPFSNDILRIENVDGSSTFIPMDESNPDYQQYLEWVAAGNTPEPWNPEQENK